MMEHEFELKEGIVKDLDFKIYNKISALRSSGISDLKTPYKYWFKYISGQVEDEEENKWQVLGTALHVLVMEPDKFFQQYAIYPEGCDRRTTEGKNLYVSFCALTMGKIILKHEDFEKVQAMANSMKSHPIYEAIFVKSQNRCIENSIFWQHNGIWIKSRPDFYNNEIIVDIKTTKEESRDDFVKAVTKYGYHRQAALQIDGLERITKRRYKYYINFVVEKKPPYLCYMTTYDDIAINQGRIEYNNASLIYAECVKNNEWPGYSGEITEINLPEWYIRQNQ
jgi:hypothetical protein